VLRKSMLGEVQKSTRRWAGFITVPMSKVRHVFMSPARSSRSTPTSPIIPRRAGHVCRRLPAGDVVYTPSPITDPRRIMMESALRRSLRRRAGRLGNTELPARRHRRDQADAMSHPSF